MAKVKMLNMDDIKSKLRESGYMVENRFRHYSVLIPLVETQRGVELLFEVRSSKLERQPGEICFPGGSLDKAETPLMCAVRETKEELGIARSRMGQVQKVQTLYGGTYFVTCFAARCDISDMAISEDEVAETFTVPLSFFMENDPEVLTIKDGPIDADSFPYEKIGLGREKSYAWRIEEKEVPVYNYEDRIIWGMTGRMIQGFIRILKGQA